MKPWPRMLVLAGLLSSAPAQAHLLRVFAFAAGEQVEGASYFSGGVPAPGARIAVYDAEGRLLSRPRPDAGGRFAFTAAARVDHLIVADTGDGHRAQWRLAAAELGGTSPTAAGAAAAPTAPTAPPGVAPAAHPEALGAALEAALARQIHPLREQLLAYQDQVRLRDLLGGIGYLLGLAGLALWWRSRGAGRGR